MPPSDERELPPDLHSEPTMAAAQHAPRERPLANEQTVTHGAPSGGLLDIPTFVRDDAGDAAPRAPDTDRPLAMSAAALPSAVFDAPPASGLPETQLVEIGDALSHAHDSSAPERATVPPVGLADLPTQGRARLRPGALALRAWLALTMGLGALVIGHHFLVGPEPPSVGPLRVISTSGAASERPTAPRVVPEPADLERPLPELERRAVAHVAAGRLGAASRAYAALAERVPHEPAYLAAAHVLAEQAARAPR